MPGTLYLVATPIGNLQDITLRALETLRSVDLIACEDTRHTRNLLNHFKISNRTISYHEHNERERAEELVERLVRGESIAVVSDAGTPGICDPGFRIVQRAIETGATVIPIPGAVAFVNAAIASGLANDSIFFGGFLPSKKGDRLKRLEDVRAIPATLIFYESPHRLQKSLDDCLSVLGNRNASVARELTKLHEEIRRGDLQQLADWARHAAPKCEMVIMIEKITADISSATNSVSLTDLVAKFEAEGVDQKTALKKAARDFGLSKSEAYRILQRKKAS